MQAFLLYLPLFPLTLIYRRTSPKSSLTFSTWRKKKKELSQRIYQNSAIQKRHSVIPDFNHTRDEWKFWGSDYPKKIPGMSHRNNRYKEEAPKLAEQAARLVLERWGGDAASISHLISVSCTGMMAPGIEFHLMQNLGLSPTINRLGINFMGCFGAFKGLSVANAFAKENEKHRILLVCSELCSLHLQADQDIETMTGQALFADGAAGAVIGAQPTHGETPLWEMIRSHSLGFKNSLEKCLGKQAIEVFSCAFLQLFRSLSAGRSKSLLEVC